MDAEASLVLGVDEDEQQNMLFPSKKANVVRMMIYELVFWCMIKI